jgi:phosphoglycolate phosphatase
MTRFSAVMFDLDGTLTDPGSGIVATVGGVLTTLGIKPPPRTELAWCVGPPLREIFARLLEPAGKSDQVDRAAALYVQNYAQVGAADSTVYPGVAQMLREVCGAARLFVVTSKNAAAAERLLGLCGLRRYFEEVAGNGRVDDKRDLVKELIERERIERGAAAIVGDRDHDVLAGKRNGIFTIGVAYGYGSREELARAGADRICETPAEVVRLILSDHART